jgi:hypothetical protein
MLGTVLRIAVLDDFQSVSGEFADWSRLPEAPATPPSTSPRRPSTA